MFILSWTIFSFFMFPRILTRCPATCPGRGQLLLQTVWFAFVLFSELRKRKLYGLSYFHSWVSANFWVWKCRQFSCRQESTRQKLQHMRKCQLLDVAPLTRWSKTFAPTPCSFTTGIFVFQMWADQLLCSFLVHFRDTAACLCPACQQTRPAVGDNIGINKIGYTCINRNLKP